MKETNGTKANGDSATPIPEEFKLLHLYWQASNYLSVGQVSTSRDTAEQLRETHPLAVVLNSSLSLFLKYRFTCLTRIH